jgi:CheY-like chemotaxis protein
MISGIRELLKASISKKASMKMNLATDLPAIAGDDPQLQQVVMNLVTNASEALGERPGLITITTRYRGYSAEELNSSLITDHLSPGCYVELEVRDSGCGMDEAVLKRLFDPFYTTKFTGRGLGMSAVMGVVRGHKGGIFITSQPNCGSTVSVLFPATATKPVAFPTLNTPPAHLENSLLPRLTGTVLIGEDETAIRLLMERILKRLGLQVLSAENGFEAVGLFREFSSEITFVILDYAMPQLDAIKTLAELRITKSDIPAVLISGFEVDQQSKADFAAFIRKPFQVEQLINVAQAMCGTH